MSAPVLVLRDVRRRHRDGDREVVALAGVNLQVAPGELVAVMGPSGSGKSTLLTLAGGLDAPDGGDVTVDGQRLDRLSRSALARLRRRRIGYVFQSLNLIASLTAAENVMLPRELDGVPSGRARREAAGVLRELGLAELADRFPDDMSGGQQQRIALARAVVGERRLILADEPTGALDSQTGEDVLRLLRARCDAGGVGAVLVTHDARHAGWADRVIFLRDGSVLDETPSLGSPESLLVGGGGVIPGSWRLGLRLAWRDALAARARTALVVVLIGLPVLVLTVVDIGYRSYQLSPHERVSRAIGTSDVGVQWSGLGGDVQQGPEGWTGNGFIAHGTMGSRVPTSAEVAALLPHGARVIPWRVLDAAITFRTRAGLALSRFTGLDLADPLIHGMARVSSGRAPRTVGEVALTTRLAGDTGLRVGDRLSAVTPARTLRVVGLVTDASHRDDSTVYALPAAVDVGTQVNNGLNVVGWLGRTTRPVTWTDVRRLNRAGFVVLSRAEFLHPSPAAVAAGVAARNGLSSTSLAVPAALVAGMALLEVVLLAGPAFAVGAKRRRRDLALLAATGGTAAQLRRVVLCSGVVLGLSAGLIGVGSGVAVAALGEPLLTPHVDRVPGHFDVRPWELLGLLVVALVTALAASIVPARSAARTPVVAALAGRRGETRVRRRTPVIGLLLVGLGVLLALTASVGSPSATVILAGVVLVELGLIACTPALIVLAARTGRRLPLPARMALRDAGRNRSAATPAVAAVMAAVIGATALLLGVAGQDDRARRQYTPTLPAHALSVDVQGVAATTAAGLATQVRRLLPTSEVAVVRGFPSSCPMGVRTCTVRRLIQPDDLPSRVSSPIGDPVIVSDGSDLTALLGHPRPDVSAALRAGRVVAADAATVHHGTVALAEVTIELVDGVDTDDPQPTPPTLHLSAVALTTGYLPAVLIVPASVAARVHIATAPLTVFARNHRTPSDARVQAVRAAARRATAATSMYVERGYRSSYAALELAFVSAAVVIAVLGAVVATALANVDGRDDLRTLGAIGAAPRVRRTLSGARAAVIAGLGTVVGVPAGALVPLALWRQSRSAGYDASSRLHFVVPWLPVVALAMVVPLVAALIAGALTRSRLPGGAAG